MKKSTIYIIISAAILVIIILILTLSPGKSSINTIKVPVKFGQFRINVTTTGELEAKNSEKILGPDGLRNFRIWQVKIEDIIPDGTVVDSGEYIAELDKTELSNKLKDKEIDLEQLETQHIKTKLDTTLELREARNELINLKYSLEEKQIAVDQSIYEPPATQRQVQIELDKTRRASDQAHSNYNIKKEKAIANMQEVSTSLEKAQLEYDQMIELLKKFTIRAPKSGMVIYRRNWNGQKQGIGSTINIWDPVVAELPNLTKMISKTYVNEIDISKVKEGQQVEIGVDAFPDKQYSGVVKKVANIGEQLKNSNTKVFEVVIEVNEFDSILRPAMTTKNTIITSIIDSVLYLPIECIRNNDSISYVNTHNSRKHVIVGKSNENEIIIRAGLKEDDQIHLIPPENAEDYKMVMIDTAIVNEIIRQDLKTKTPKKKQPGKDEQIEQSEISIKKMSKEDIDKKKPDRRKKN
jgi:hypothetical protein